LTSLAAPKKPDFIWLLLLFKSRKELAYIIESYNPILMRLPNLFCFLQ
jgi:hypothetical protein